VIATKSQKTWLLFVAALAVAVCAIAVLALSNESSTASADTRTASARPIHLAALNAAPSEQAVPFLEHDFLARSGYDAPKGRLLGTDAAGSQVIGIPRNGDATSDAQGEFCVIVTQAGQPLRGNGACDSVERFNETGVFLTLTRGNPDTDEVVGVLPDGVVSVSVRSSEGQAHTIDVDANVVRFPLKGAADVTFDGPSGAVSQPIAGGLNE
jgi:hypothetical protein